MSGGRVVWKPPEVVPAPIAGLVFGYGLVGGVAGSCGFGRAEYRG